jgi:hypothetical protein
MDPNETSPSQPYQPPNPTNVQPLGTIKVPQPPNPVVINSDKYFTWAQVQADFAVANKRVGFGMVVLFVSIVGISFTIDRVKSLFAHEPTQSQPSDRSNSTSVANKTTNATIAVIAKCGNDRVSNVKVDKIFAKQHPELNGRKLTNSAADKPLQSEWCAIADRLRI